MLHFQSNIGQKILWKTCNLEAEFGSRCKTSELSEVQQVSKIAPNVSVAISLEDTD